MANQNQHPTQADYYNTAVQLHNHEFRTLGERSNLLIVAQSILITAFVFILAWQSNFPYVFPYVASGIIMVGIIFCVLHHCSGRIGAQAAFKWRQYMRDEIEREDTNGPWHYLERNADRLLLDRLPLPSSWLFTPTIFLATWFAASLYIPVRLLIDENFAVASCRCLACAVSIIILIIALLALCFICWRVRSWWRRETK